MKKLYEMDFDTSDADSVGRNVGGPVRTKPTVRTPANPKLPKQNPTSHLPGLPPERRKNEADGNTPFGGSRAQRAQRPTQQIDMGKTPRTAPVAPPARAPQVTPPRANPMAQPPQASTQPPRRRGPKDTMQLQPGMTEPAQRPAPAKTMPGEKSWSVTVAGAGVYNVPAPDEQTARTRAADFLASGGDPDVAGKTFPPEAFQVGPSESSAGGSIGAGPQRPLGELGLEIFRQLVNQRLQEIVRKKEGGGGYNLYSPNKGKKKKSKPVGEFPTRLAAKRAELARFPPKDPEQLKRARKRLDKLAKDPKKRQDAERKELSVKKPKRSGKAAGERKARKEAIIASMASSLRERLFREDEVPGSPWDERIANLHPSALSKDKKLHKYHQGMEKASVAALGDGSKVLSKMLRGLARANPGEIGIDSGRGKMFMPVGLDVDGTEVGPIHLYIDGGNVCIEISQEAREAIAGLDPRTAQDLRGGLMSFQEDALPKIDRAKRAWNERDSYLDSLHQRLEKTFGGMSDVEHHLVRQLMAKRRR